MKKLLLSIIGAASLMTVNAAVPPTTTPVWTNTIYSVANAEDVNYSAKMAFTASGETYVAGIVSGEGFRFCPNMVEPVGVSSYVAKYDAIGVSAWAVTIKGAATVTAITTDAQGDVYVAGTLADKVTFESTDGTNVIEVEGCKDEYGDYTTDQKAAFIAKYDANGALKAVNTFVPSILPEIKTAMDLAMSTIFFYIYDNYASFNIKDIEVVGEKLIVGATFGGTTTVGDVEFKGAYQNEEGWLFVDLANSAVFSLDTATLSTPNVVFSTSVKGGETSNGASTTSVAFDVNDGVLYASAIVSGEQDITLGSTSETKEYSNNEGVVEYATIVAAINLSDKSVKASKVYTNTTDNSNKDEVNKVIAEGGKVYVGGLAHSALAFDNAKEVKGHGDLYIASLNANDLAVNWTALSGVEEGSGTDNGEVFVNMISFGDNLVVAGYTEKLSDRTPIEGISAYVDKADGVFSLSEEDKVVKSALEANGAFVGAAVYTIAENVANITYSVAKLEGSAIESVEAENNAAVKYYNLQGVEVAGENMPAGIYVCKKGNKVAKVLVK